MPSTKPVAEGPSPEPDAAVPLTVFDEVTKG